MPDRQFNQQTAPIQSAQQTFNNVEAASILKVSVRTLQKYRDNGLIEFSQVGRKIVYTLAQIEVFLARNTRSAFNIQRKI